MRKWIIAIIIVALFGWAIFDFVITSPNKNASEEVTANVGIEKGDLAPDFELETLHGEMVKLSDYKGEKVLLNFWATWCPPCRVEIPDIQKYHEDNDDVVILAVNLLESENSPRNVTSFVEEYGMTFEVLSDKNSVVATTFEAYSLPTSYLIDSDGIIQNKVVGPLNYEAMVREFSKMN